MAASASVFVLLFAYMHPSVAVVAAALLGAAAGATWYGGARRRLRELHRWASRDNMLALTPEAFEHHVADTYAAMGYKVATTRRVGDQGIDVLAARQGELLGIQCKRTTETVSNSAVQEAYAGKAHYRCTAAAVVSLGGFTASARSLASSTNIVLIDGPGYADLFHRATAAIPNTPLWKAIPQPRTAIISGALALTAIAMLVLGMAGESASHTTFAVTGGMSAASQSPAGAVEAFYGAIDDKRYEDAYALLSPSFRKSMSFAQLVAGYHTTVHVSATAIDSPELAVDVRLVATDRNPDGSTRTASYRGVWRTIANGRGSWLLDDGHFRRL